MSKRHLNTLWSIRMPGQHTNRSSYLFGSMHLRDQKVFGRVPQLIDLMQQVTDFYTEIDLSEAMTAPISLLQMPNDLRIKDLLGEKKYTKLQAVVKKAYQFEIGKHQRDFPLLLLNKIAERCLSEEEPMPLDMLLWSKAKAAGLNLKGLEKFHDHIGVLSRIPLEFQAKELYKLKRNPNKLRKKTNALVKLYEAEDIKLLYKLSKKSLGKYKDVMIYSRNEKMANNIAQNINTPSIYVVGAGHLWGANGMLRSLKSKSLVLSPVKA